VVRVAILSDTHGAVDPRVLEVVATCDLAVHGGDIGSGEVLEAIGRRLRPGAGALHAVLGNNDIPAKWPECHRALLPELPERLEIDLPGGRLAVIHGHQTPARGRHDRLRRIFPDANAIVYGHSHRLVTDRLALPWVINPGAAGRSRTFGGPSCLVLTAARLGWHLESHRFPVLGQPRAEGRKQTPSN
jgi:putative phosphoesterase